MIAYRSMLRLHTLQRPESPLLHSTPIGAPFYPARPLLS